MASHYDSCFDKEMKGWAIVLEEKAQPTKKIVGSGFKELPQDILARRQWFELSRPLIAHCPSGTANPG